MFDRFGIRSRVLALALVPLIVVVGFGAIELQDRQATASDASALAGDVEFGVIATDLVHELQRERGLSSGFVGDPSASIDQVAAQRTAADAARARFDAAFEGLDADFQAQLAVVVVNLDELAEHRVLVDARAISIGETLAPYTEVIGQLLDGLTTLDFSIDDAELVQQAVALRNLSRGKELTGLERGFMNGVVGRGAFADAGEVADYLRIQSDSFVYLDTFDQNATAEQVAAFESRLAEVGPASADLRATLRATPVGTPIPFGADVWWETMTERIDVMRQSEVELSASVVAIADGIAADGSAALTTFVITGLGLAIGLALLAFVIARSISAPVRRLTKDARRVADVDLPDVVARIAAGEDAELEATEHGAGPAEIGQLVESMDTLRDTAATLASEQATMRRNVGELFISLGRRNQNLLTRQLDFIDHLEQEEQDPEVLDNLYRLDHLSTRIRRNAESLLVLAGAESPRPWTTPVEMGDVIRAAMAETEDYSRVDLRAPEAVMLTGGVVSDTTHLLAELLENATRFSPPTSMVTVAGRAQAEGFVIAVADEGIGLAPDQIADLNDLLATPADTLDLADTGKLGLQVVARLAKRHGITVDLYPNGVAGLTARVVIPSSLIAAAPAPPVEPPPAAPMTPAPEPATAIDVVPAVQPVVESPSTTEPVAPAPTTPVAETVAPAQPAAPAEATSPVAPARPEVAPATLAGAMPPVPDTPEELTRRRSPFAEPVAAPPEPAATGMDVAMEALREESASPFGETLEQRRARYLEPLERRAETAAQESGGLARRVRKEPDAAVAPAPLGHGPEDDRDPAKVRSMLAGLAAGQAQARTQDAEPSDPANPFAPRPTTTQEPS